MRFADLSPWGVIDFLHHKYMNSIKILFQPIITPLFSLINFGWKKSYKMKIAVITILIGYSIWNARMMFYHTIWSWLDYFWLRWVIFILYTQCTESNKTLMLLFSHQYVKTNISHWAQIYYSKSQCCSFQNLSSANQKFRCQKWNETTCTNV